MHSARPAGLLLLAVALLQNGVALAGGNPANQGISAVSAKTARCPKSQLTVVYNAMVWPDNNWRMLISAQLRHLRTTRLPTCATVHVVLSAPAVQGSHNYSEVEKNLVQARELALQALQADPDASPRIFVWTVHENSFEYPGIHLLWFLAQQAASNASLFLYFHSKGMVNHGWLEERYAPEKLLLQGTIDPWREIVGVFEKNTSITRIGMYPAQRGWVWFNFWWARGSFLRTRPEPMRVTRRHYYEDWLGRERANVTPGGGENTAAAWTFDNCTTCCAFQRKRATCGVQYAKPNLKLPTRRL